MSQSFLWQQYQKVKIILNVIITFIRASCTSLALEALNWIHIALNCVKNDFKWLFLLIIITYSQYAVSSALLLRKQNEIKSFWTDLSRQREDNEKINILFPSYSLSVFQKTVFSSNYITLFSFLQCN